MSQSTAESSARDSCTANTLLRDRGALDPLLAAAVRRQFFCAAVDAGRHHVSADEVIAHLIQAGLAITPRSQRVLAHLPDVILAIACARGDATAWNDLINAHAWCLDRACTEQLGPNEGLTFARRFWRDLKSSTLGTVVVTRRPRASATRLQQYSGVRPIRLWLADRLLGAAASTAPKSMQAARTADSLDSEGGMRSLPLPAGHAGGSAT